MELEPCNDAIAVGKLQRHYTNVLSTTANSAKLVLADPCPCVTFSKEHEVDYAT